MNKIIVSIVFAVILVLGINKITDLIFYVEKPEESAYQVIAKRGSRGGGFRYIYEEFLKFAESESSKINELKLSNEMHNIARLWEESALLMKKISDKKNRKDLVNLKKNLSNLYNLEYEYHSKVLDSLGSKKKGA